MSKNVTIQLRENTHAICQISKPMSSWLQKGEPTQGYFVCLVACIGYTGSVARILPLTTFVNCSYRN